MVSRLSVIGMMGLLLALGSGCKPCCSAGDSAAKPGGDGGTAPADGQAHAIAQPAQTEKGAKTKEVKVAVTGMT